MRYTPTHRMCDLMSANNHPHAEGQILQLLNRFGIPLGVGDKTISAVCEQQGVDCETLLTIVNYAIHKEIDNGCEININTLDRYLENAHSYFLDFQLPRIRQELLQTLNLATSDTKVPLMIIQFFDEYVEEIRAHIDHEKEHSYEQHAYDDKHVAQKAKELKNLIIKYYPTSSTEKSKNEVNKGEIMSLLYTVLHDLHHFEQELALHCAIEDDIMLPALRKLELLPKENALDSPHQESGEKLSNREIDIVKQIALGLSNKEIADTLCLSTHTVMSHRKNIARKLDIHSTAGLTIYAVVNGIVKI